MQWSTKRNGPSFADQAYSTASNIAPGMCKHLMSNPCDIIKLKSANQDIGLQRFLTSLQPHNVITGMEINKCSGAVRTPNGAHHLLHVKYLKRALHPTTILVCHG